MAEKSGSIFREPGDRERYTMPLRSLKRIAHARSEVTDLKQPFGLGVTPIGHSGEEHAHLTEDPDGGLPPRDENTTFHAGNAQWRIPDRMHGPSEDETK